jgi:Ulp1 protease family, C-terminal catalytic domain
MDERDWKMSGVSTPTRTKPSSQTPLSRRLQLCPPTVVVIRREVLDFLREHQWSTSRSSSYAIDMATALRQSDGCISSYALERPVPVASTNDISTATDLFPGHPDSRSRDSQEKEWMERRYNWMAAFERLERCPSLMVKMISSWEDAKEVLEDILEFPPSLCDDYSSQSVGSGTDASSGSIRDKHATKLDAAMCAVQDLGGYPNSNHKWTRVAAAHVPKKLSNKVQNFGKVEEEEEDVAALIQEVSIDKSDLRLACRIRIAEEHDHSLREQGTEIDMLEDRRKAAEEAAEEAEKRASSLMRSLSDKEKDTVRRAVFEGGPENEILAQCGTDSVQRSSMQTLRPRTWLNDEIIHYFYLMLANRDAELCGNDPSRKRSHFFKSFFITKLLNEGNANPAIDGTYEYRNVKRWSKNVPGKDIFALDKVVLPINMGGMHWICAAIFMKEKRIEIFDSMGAPGTRYLKALFRYLNDEHQDKKKAPMPDVDQWKLVESQATTPRQLNGAFITDAYLKSVISS